MDDDNKEKFFWEIPINQSIIELKLYQPLCIAQFHAYSYKYPSGNHNYSYIYIYSYLTMYMHVYINACMKPHVYDYVFSELAM